MALLELKGITAGYGQNVILRDFNLNVERGEFVSLLGSSGCGKTTPLRLIAGFSEPMQGTISFDGRDYTHVPLHKRNFGFVFQSYALFPHMTVFDNVAFGLKMRKLDKAVIQRDVMQMLKLVDLEGFENRYPREMSGGQRQRVALARAMVIKPDLMLFDEPLSNLDAKLRVKMRVEIRRIQQELGFTAIYVTHDQEECFAISDKVAIMNKGLIEQMDAPSTIYNSPNTEFIARFAANKAKSKQATSRRRLLDKLSVEEMPASSRRYPFVGFEREREVGKDILFVTDVSKTIDGVKLLDKVSFIVGKNDKIAFVGENELAQTTMFKILMGELEPDEGSVKWGQTVTTSYLPKDNTEYFEGQTESLVDWIRQFSAKKDDVYLRGFLGRMLFSGDEVFKPVNVLSGGEKVRCMLSRMMLSGANVILLDQPTNHLDMEAIQAVNKGLDAFPGNILLASHDHELLQTTCNRVIEFQPDGKIIDRLGTYDEYLEWKLAK